MFEQRLEDIEVKLTRQEDLVDVLNQQIYQQQLKIDELSSLCNALISRVRELSSQTQQTGLPHERPPHY